MNTNKIVSNIVIDSDTTNNGMIVGNILVSNNSKFILSGMVNGDIQIESGAELVCHGMINGNVLNYGKFKLYGTLNGEITNKGEKYIDINASLNKK
ncbi:hypothetical protein [Pontibacter liquoris]|uniref:hypothetical protein n=1 Tax=Pontibacter liquoris TaxID=2905677 RepID=UPI001FA6F030|nr:hypothetical protein [Pontibacter liquoris]